MRSARAGHPGVGGSMNVFEFRNHLIADYQRFSRSFTKIRADDIQAFVKGEYRDERFWPAPLTLVAP